MVKWKYKVMNKRIKSVSELSLNKLGNKGWELIFMSQLWNGKIIAVFKKQT